jgi:hypothetical protein
MKKSVLLSLLFAVIAVISSCKKEEESTGTGGSSQIVVDAKQRSLLMDFTATWCGPCGAYGTPTLKKIAATHSDKMVGISFHTGTSELSPYYYKGNTDSTVVSSMFSIIFGSSGIESDSTGTFGLPSFTLNQKMVMIKEEEIKPMLDANYKTSPLAGVGLRVERTSKGVNITPKIKFFNAAEGEYFLSLYFIEDNINHRQYDGFDYVKTYEHDHILRGSAIGPREQPATFGTAINTQAVTILKNQEFMMDKIVYVHDTRTPNSSSSLDNWVWKPQNTSIAAIIWKKDGKGYKFINGTTVKL